LRRRKWRASSPRRRVRRLAGAAGVFVRWRGKLITRTEASHTHVEWLRFLKQIDRETPRGLDLHLIADNYATHKHPKVQAWLVRHPRFTMHFTPTSSSWLNLVERFFADLTGDVIRAGSFASVNELRPRHQDVSGTPQR
jgi:hypothetical protein